MRVIVYDIGSDLYSTDIMNIMSKSELSNLDKKIKHTKCLTTFDLKSMKRIDIIKGKNDATNE